MFFLVGQFLQNVLFFRIPCCVFRDVSSRNTDDGTRNTEYIHLIFNVLNATTANSTHKM